MSAQSFDEMLIEFRALGGVADNVCQREGAFGRGIFPLDPQRPVALRVPHSLLIDAADVVFQNGAFRIGPNSKMGVREIAFVETYQNAFSWGGGGRTEVERIFTQAQDVPENVREKMHAQKHTFGSWFGDVDEALIQQSFIESRHLGHEGREVLMPVIELVNHSPDVESYEIGTGVGIGGTFSGEVLVRYSQADAYGVFGVWGFASDQPQALSIGFKGTADNFSVAIGRELDGELSMPKCKNTPEGIALPFLMIGNKKYPRLCKGIFYKLMREARVRGFEEAFDKIQCANLQQASDLLELFAEGDGPMMATLRRVVSYQLRAMAHCFGVRAI